MYRKIVVSLPRRTLVLSALLILVCGGVSRAAAPGKVHVGIAASFVRAGGGALWVTDRVDNRLTRVDPAAGRVAWRLSLGGSPFGVTYGAGSVWVAARNGNVVTRVNPTTKRKRARIKVGGSPYSLAYGAGAVWVSNESGSVSRIAPRRNRVVKTIRLGGQPNGIAVAFGKVWVGDYGRGRLIRIDPGRNRVERRISIPKADWITASADSLWVSSETGKIYRVDPVSLAVEAVVSVGANPLASAWIGGRLWVPNIDDNTVSLVDPGANAVVRTIAVGQSPLAVAEASGSAWVTSDFDGDLWRLDP
jgi:YVTN family beta-propeller protein